ASLSGLKVVIDAANGAGVSAAEPVFRSLGAEVIMLADTPDGVNINTKCGALHPEGLSEVVRAHSADVGIAFDGDADRIIVVDENGEVADGDQIMGAIAIDAKAQGRLAGDTVVATIMSNLGLEGALSREGIKLERTKVGDRYVVERLREGGFSIGGEQSGHVVLANHVTTGDAIIAAIAVLSIMVREDKKASEVLSVFEPVPQLLENVRYQSDDPLSAESVKARIESVSETLGDSGRVVVRKSGTEPLIRVMAEAYERGNAERAVGEIIAEILKADGQ
ncbi:MAG TPA: phosphoglucosamine mutase, partial [Hyphomonadaceae bacterium]|nr:phosphoglucosamine mutase [Hyphomonadaceae bacterium]